MSDADDHVDAIRHFLAGGWSGPDDPRTAGLSDRLTDADLSVDTGDLEPRESGDARDALRHGAREHSFSVAVRLELVDRTTCPFCHAVNDIPDPALLTLMEADVPCAECGHPLEVVR